MTDFFVSPAASGGSDSSNGLGPDASHGTNKPWATLGKALNTGSAVVPGDTVYIAPGVLFEGAAVAPIAGVSSTASPTAVRGDPQNSQGFKNASGVLLPPGVCWVTPRTSGDTIDGPISSGAFGLIDPVTDCHGMQWYNVAFEFKQNSDQADACVRLYPEGNTDWLFERCRSQSLHLIGYRAGTPTAGRDLTVHRCVILGNLMYFDNGNPAATANADMAILFADNWVLGGFHGSGGWKFTGTGGNLAGGVIVRGNTMLRTNTADTNAALATQAGTVSTVTPVRLQGNMIWCGGVSCGTSGQVVSDGYNRFQGGAHTNFTPHGTDKTGFLGNIVLPDLEQWGLELPRSDVGAWTDAAAALQRASAWTNTDPDIRGRTPRPWGAGASIGCWETGGISQDATSAITGGGVNSLKITGAGEVSLFVGVAAVDTTITIKTKSTSYGGTDWPQLVAVANPTIGITSSFEEDATSAAEQTLTLALGTPTAAGVLELRLISRSSSVTSATYFDVLV